MVLADEPTGALDVKTGREVMGVLKDLVKEQNITVIVVTHESEVAKFTERTIQLSDGEIIRDRKNR